MKLDNDLQLQITDVSAVRETGECTSKQCRSGRRFDEYGAKRFDESNRYLEK